jgi:hypothetical protein
VFHDAGTLTVAQLVHKFPALYGTRLFLTAFPTDISLLSSTRTTVWMKVPFLPDWRGSPNTLSHTLSLIRVFPTSFRLADKIIQN